MLGLHLVKIGWLDPEDARLFSRILTYASRPTMIAISC